jgi:hypothetical protein
MRRSKRLVVATAGAIANRTARDKRLTIEDENACKGIR